MKVSLKKHNIFYRTEFNHKFQDSENKKWKKTREIYNFYNNILTSRKLIICNIFINQKLIKYFFLKFYYEIKYRLKNKKLFGFYEKYKEIQIIELFSNKRIKTIYEFGSGASTILIAKQLHRQHLKFGVLGKLKSFDQSQEWIEHLKKKIPKHLTRYFEIKKCKLEYFEKKGFRFIKYKDIKYQKNIDAAYIDGPGIGLIKNIPKCKTIICGNILDLMQKKVNYIFTDKRFSTINIKNKFSKAYCFSINLYFRSVIAKYDKK